MARMEQRARGRKENGLARAKGRSFIKWKIFPTTYFYLSSTTFLAIFSVHIVNLVAGSPNLFPDAKLDLQS